MAGSLFGSKVSRTETDVGGPATGLSLPALTASEGLAGPSVVPGLTSQLKSWSPPTGFWVVRV